MISHKLRAISNKPPGKARTTPRLLPKSSEIVPDTNMMYPINPQIENSRGTIFDLYNIETNNNPPKPHMDFKDDTESLKMTCSGGASFYILITKRNK